MWKEWPGTVWESCGSATKTLVTSYTSLRRLDWIATQGRPLLACFVLSDANMDAQHSTILYIFWYCRFTQTIRKQQGVKTGSEDICSKALPSSGMTITERLKNRRRTMSQQITYQVVSTHVKNQHLEENEAQTFCHKSWPSELRYENRRNFLYSQQQDTSTLCSTSTFPKGSKEWFDHTNWIEVSVL